MDFSTLWTETGSTTEKIAIAAAIGVVIAAIIMLFQKKHMGKLVRALTNLEAYDSESAKTLKELKIGRSPFIRRALKDPTSSLSRVVTCVLPSGQTLLDNAKEKAEREANRKRGEAKVKAEKVNIDECKFYIEKEKSEVALERYSTKNSNVFLIIVTAVFALLIAYLVIKFLPILLEWRPFAD